MKTFTFSNYEDAKQYNDKCRGLGYWTDLIRLKTGKYKVEVAEKPPVLTSTQIKNVIGTARKKVEEHYENKEKRDVQRLSNLAAKAEREKRKAEIKIEQAKTKTQLIKAQTDLRRAATERLAVTKRMNELKFAGWKGSTQAVSRFLGVSKPKSKKRRVAPKKQVKSSLAYWL